MSTNVSVIRDTWDVLSKDLWIVFHNTYLPRSDRERKRNTVKLDAEKQQSSIARHLCNSKTCADAYQQDWFSVLDTAQSSFHLQTLEAVYICSRDPSLCRQKQFVYSLKVFK